MELSPRGVTQWGAHMLVAVRAITYPTLFVALLLIYLPGRVLSWSGISRPPLIEWPQIIGMTIATTGVLIAVWCIFTFARIGNGTPAPFDPPRRSGDSRPLSICQESDVHWCGTGLSWSCAILRVAQPFGLQLCFPSRLSCFRCVVRGTHAPTHLWTGIWRISASRQQMVSAYAGRQIRAPRVGAFPHVYAGLRGMVELCETAASLVY
jgi:hypothetical protein